MNYLPKKSCGKWLGLILGLAIFSFTIWGINYSLSPDDRTLKIMLYIPVYLFLVVYVYLIVGAFNMYYRVTDDAFVLTWGIQKKYIPWEDFNEVLQIKGHGNLYPFLAASWPGYIIGLFQIKGIGPVRMYATHAKEGFLYLKTQKGFFGITPDNDDLLTKILEKTGKDLQTVDINELPIEVKGENLEDDRFFRLYHKLNLVFLLVFAAYVAIFFPSNPTAGDKFVILLLTLAIALYFFNISNAKRIHQFTSQGAYITLVIGLAVTGIFLILSISQISLTF